jgi:hypothetical protein
MGDMAMTKRFTTLGTAAFAALAVAACATPDPAPRTAQSETTVETTAVIQTVDKTTREVLLRTEDGRFVTMTAGPEVRNFDQLASGDRVRAVFTESIVAGVAAPDQPSETVVTTAGTRAPVGATPGAAVGEAITSVVEIVSYDAASALVTFRGPSGLLHSVVVPPEMRDFVAARRPGERVAVELVQAFAVGIVEF